MDKVQELQLQLNRLKQEEKAASLQRECEQLKTAYEGKAYGSRAFERAAKSALETAMYIRKIYIGKPSSNTSVPDQLLADIYQVRVSQHDSNYKFSSNNYNYSRSRNEETTVSSNRIFGLMPYSKKEISVDKFMSLWNACLEHEAVLQKPFAEKVQADYSDMIRQGDHTDESQISIAIDKIGMDVVDVQNDHPKLWDKIKYARLPMFHNNRWMLKEYGARLLKYQISLWEEELNSPWKNSGAYRYLTESIEVVKSHLKYFS